MRVKATDTFDLNSSFATITVLLGLLFRITLFCLSIGFIFISPQYTPIKKDEIIYYSYQHKYFVSSFTSLYMLTLFVPLTCILITSAWRYDSLSSSAHAIYSLSGALSVTSFLITFLQVVCAKRTPDFVSRCWPEGAGLDKCTGDPFKVTEGLRSFPSGIASWSICNLFWTSLFISEKLALFSPSGRSQFWKLCIFVFINYSAVLISLIPFNLNSNFGVDILAGGLIGLVTAALFYFLNYSSLLQTNSQTNRSQQRILPINV